MDHKDLKAYIKHHFPHLKKPIFNGDPIRLFDEEYYIPSFDRLDRMVAKALSVIQLKGLGYIEDKSDCDNWALWIQSEVTMQWALESNVNAAIAFGFDTDKGHALNIGVTKQGIKFWNYGIHVPDWAGKIIEVEFK